MYGAIVDKFNRFMLSVPGYMEGKLEELASLDATVKGVTADDLRRDYFGGKLRIDVAPQTSLWMMANMAEVVAQLYYQMKWTVYQSTGGSFVTSDCPVHRFHPPGTGNPRLALTDPLVEVHFPLNRARMLVLRHDPERMQRISHLAKAGRNREVRQAQARASDIAYETAPDVLVNALNLHTITMANRWVFAPAEDVSIPDLFRGQCKNVTHEVTQMPGGLIRIASVYPEK